MHPKDKLIDAAIALGAKISKHSQIAAAFAKRAVKQTLEVGESAAVDHERSLFIALLGTEDKKEGVKAFLEKRKPNFTNS